MTLDLNREEVDQFRENLEAHLNGLTKDPAKIQLASSRLRAAKKSLNCTVGCVAMLVLTQFDVLFLDKCDHPVFRRYTGWSFSALYWGRSSSLCVGMFCDGRFGHVECDGKWSL